MSVPAIPPRIAILAALPREVAPLVRDWPAPVVSRREGTSIWQSDRAIVVCAGMGRERVTLAFQLAESRGPLSAVFSVGYAGALREGMRIDGAHWPAIVIDGQTGERFACEEGEGILITADRVIGADEKPILAARWNADLVDMEAATVARLARERALPFRAVRAISDPVDDYLPELGHFTNARGGFESARFARYVALHPWLIPTTIKLGKRSARASRAVAAALLKILRQAE
ncbi:MAG TPA: phosphorylase [Acidobacteriaceae bacterium]|nr:phosphorylase [Acidobacteriaceae bacterium]